MAQRGEMRLRLSFLHPESKPRGLQHVLAAGADFLVRVGWNSVRMITPDGAPRFVQHLRQALAGSNDRAVPSSSRGIAKGEAIACAGCSLRASLLCASTRRSLSARPGLLSGSKARSAPRWRCNR